MFKLDCQCEINGLALLKDVATLGLFLLLNGLDIDVPPHEDGGDKKRTHASASNGHGSHDIPVGVDDSVADWVANGIGQLLLDIAVDGQGEVLALLGQVLLKLGGKLVGPEAGGDGVSGRRADGAEESVDGDGDGDICVASRSHQGQLRHGGQKAGRETDENLAHGYVAYLCIGLAEVDD